MLTRQPPCRPPGWGSGHHAAFGTPRDWPRQDPCSAVSSFASIGYLRQRKRGGSDPQQAQLSPPSLTEKPGQSYPAAALAALARAASSAIDTGPPRPAPARTRVCLPRAVICTAGSRLAIAGGPGRRRYDHDSRSTSPSFDGGHDRVADVRLLQVRAEFGRDAACDAHLAPPARRARTRATCVATRSCERYRCRSFSRESRIAASASR